MSYIYIIEFDNNFKIGVTFILPELYVFKLNNYGTLTKYKLIFEGQLEKKLNGLTVEKTIHDYLKEMNVWVKEDIFNKKKDNLQGIIKSIQNIII